MTSSAEKSASMRWASKVWKWNLGARLGSQGLEVKLGRSKGWAFAFLVFKIFMANIGRAKVGEELIVEQSPILGK